MKNDKKGEILFFVTSKREAYQACLKLYQKYKNGLKPFCIEVYSKI